MDGDPHRAALLLGLKAIRSPLLGKAKRTEPALTNGPKPPRSRKVSSSQAPL